MTVQIDTEHLKKLANEKVIHYDNLLKKQKTLSPFHQEARELAILTLELVAEVERWRAVNAKLK